jgi:hypothetical protein
MADWGGKVAAWFAGVAQTAKEPLHGWLRTLFVALVVIAVVSFVALLLTGPRALWAAWRNRGRAESALPAAPAKPDPAQLPPLMVRLLEPPQWENWKYIALIGAFHIEITNTTGRAILIGSFAFTTDNRGLASWESNATDVQHIEIRREVHARQEGHRYGPSLRIHSQVPAHATVSGWFVTAVTRNPAGGTPECTFMVQDDIGNEYPVTIERQDPQKGPA